MARAGSGGASHLVADTGAQLGRLAEAARDVGVRLRGSPRTVVTGLSCDIHKVKPGDLFFCVHAVVDGHDLAAEAVAAGASALCVERATGAGVPELEVTSARRAMAMLAPAFFGWPAARLRLVGITGSLGKTTTTWLVEAILRAAGRRTGLVGSLTAKIAGDPRWLGGTTPEPTELHALFADMRAAGVADVAMEVSSHALALHRVDGLRFAVATFTNLSPDHLDFHGDLARYFAAKRSLFASDRAERAVVNVDDACGRLLWGSLAIPRMGFAVDGPADVTAHRLRLDADGSTFLLRTPHGETEITTPLVGEHNVRNCVAAAATALMAGVDLRAIAAGIADVRGIPGRLERIDAGQPFAVFVDFARTPEALGAALRAARLAAGPAGRVSCVFGCGGDGETEKRAHMGSLAARGADRVVITLDDPLDEDPLEIAEAISAGALAAVPGRRPDVVLDRREAIGTAIRDARAGDVVLVTGRGSELYHTILGHTFVLDDREIARASLAGLGFGTR